MDGGRRWIVVGSLRRTGGAADKRWRRVDAAYAIAACACAHAFGW